MGVTYPFATLPSEVYAASSYDNGVGVILTKTYEMDEGTLNIDGFYTNLKVPIRTYDYITKKTYFPKYDFDLYGLSIDYLSDYENKYRVGFYRALEDSVNGTVDFIILGAEYNFENEIKILSEFSASKVRSTVSNSDTQGFYVAALKSYDHWTNYLRYGIEVPKNKGRQSYTIGTAYKMSPLQKIKLEYKYVTTGGDTKSFIDNKQIYSNQNINLLSISYNYAF